MTLNKKNLRVGIAGGIGSGKSTVGKLLSDMGYTVIDCDDIAHTLYKSHEVKQAIIDFFGERFYEKGELNRRELGAYCFSDAERTAKLNKIFDSAIRGRLFEYFERYFDRTVFVLVPLLFESGYDTLFDFCWTVNTTKENQLIRVGKRDGLSEADIENRIRRQINPDERIKRADTVIDNNGDIDSLKRQITDAINRYIKK